MGVWDLVGKNEIETKCTRTPEFKHYEVGALIDLEEGLYFGTGGWFVVKEGKVLCDGVAVWDKWGNRVENQIWKESLDKNNPLLLALQDMKNFIAEE